VGFTVEAYHFFSVGIISTQIWPQLFDGSSSSALALFVLAYSTILVGRAAGGLMFGHLGDKLGRK
jgi:MFS family permease